MGPPPSWVGLALAIVPPMLSGWALWAAGAGGGDGEWLYLHQAAVASGLSPTARDAVATSCTWNWLRFPESAQGRIPGTGHPDWQPLLPEIMWDSKRDAPAWGPARPCPLCSIQQQLKPGVHPWVAPGASCL